MRAMIVKEFRELRRDHRTMAMLFALPIVLLVVFGYAANFTIDSISTQVVGPHADQVATLLPPLFDVQGTDPGATADDARGLVRDDVADVVLDTSTSPPTAYVDGSSLFVAQTASAALGRAGDQVLTEVLFNPDLTTSWVMVPALVGLILTFVGTIITSIGLVRERQTGTLEQLAVMPLRPADVIVGKIAPYFLLASFDMLVVTLLGVWIFGVPFNGNPALFALAAATFLFVVLGVGVLISTASQTQGQAIQVALMTLMPQILLSGFIFPLQAMPAAISWIGYCLPLTWFVKVSQGIMLRGAGLDSLWPALVVLAAMAVLVFSAAVLRFRRDLAPARRTTARTAEPVSA
ncbi:MULTISPECIES: ABC transporter permease [Cellulomonas]|uniref:Transport permease protein n=1 Tax=Cellulomonas gelida TaxID=1712 RepID=A0A4Y3KR57_9CELL|nr:MULTISPECIES: ABC transporter permease [Cellulomonas]MCR6703588.1 ABC transporter permease [Cellulomonas sp.]GEA85368.1 transport permease protein [Cellulomonas gelida]GGL36195.1 transport permease protein [Cellulomonas gelida]